MAEVALNINGRVYHMACDDGQEPHLLKLASVISEKVTTLVREVGQVGDARLLLMASLLMADEYGEMKGQLESLRGDTVAQFDDAEEVLSEGLESLAERVEQVAARLGAP
jgi:cell division protein ZapA